MPNGGMCFVILLSALERIMSIQPKILNHTISGYGEKKSGSNWQVSLDRVMGSVWTGRSTGFPSIKDLYDVSEYEHVINESVEYLNHFQTSAMLQTMNEADLAAFFYLGMAYLKIGETDKAISCLHIVLSQNRFVHKLLPGFSQYVDLSFYELSHMADKFGDDFINMNDPDKFLSELGKLGNVKN